MTTNKKYIQKGISQGIKSEKKKLRDAKLRIKGTMVEESNKMEYFGNSSKEKLTKIRVPKIWYISLSRELHTFVKGRSKNTCQ